ncbi:LysR family transcriptional regulator [Burkholderia cenocepacia]|uniref:LysR family transcriptional regulator n=1 Tax=Burkholderia cenocepacia TaxID=95486 RepID=UPI002231778C|nr:LysR family transcriptional regulator [Burkholderia cenocepacia]MCW3605124.1 LysR family transcriptional regulator [Burkholderia cenocepacia]MCW5191749.1 LysR family transcriptional regulator [Burkholderia cenocepacia]
MDLIQSMQAFVTLADAGTFTETGKRLGITTAHVSRLVASLEHRLGIRLLNRTTRSMCLTEAGERYLARARDITLAVDASEREARDARVHPHGRLRAHCSASIANHFVIPLIGQFQARYPDVSVDLTLAPHLPKLVRDSYDVAVIAMPSLPSSEQVAIDVGRIRSVLCASPAYLDAHGMPDSPGALVHHRCVQLVAPAYHERIWTLWNGAQAQTVDVDPSMTADVAASLAIAVREGAGIGLLPDFVAAADLRSGALVRVLPDYQAEEIGVFLVYASRQHLDAKTRAWVDFMKAALRDAFAQMHDDACAPPAGKKNHAPGKAGAWAGAAA